MAKQFTRKIVLEDGREFYGYGFGAACEAINEIVFNTSMVGYQEIVSDPSYTNQMVCMTYPLIGNYGITDGFVSPEMMAEFDRVFKEHGLKTVKT